MKVKLYHCDNLQLLESLPDGTVDLIYIDQPFNTGIQQKRTRIKTTKDLEGTRIGFGGEAYKEEKISTSGYDDSFDDFIGYLRLRLALAHSKLKPNGSLFFHIDWRESAYCKILLDEIFGGREHCMNELIWSYDFGGRGKNKWPCKHDTIYWYAKDPQNYTFNYDDIDRIPYMAPDLVTKEKAARGKTPTDVWWNTIVPTNGKEKTGYPTQKPLAILERIVKVHSNRGDWVFDFFAGSGTTGEAAIKHGRKALLCDKNPEAIRVMEQRFGVKAEI